MSHQWTKRNTIVSIIALLFVCTVWILFIQYGARFAADRSPNSLRPLTNKNVLLRIDSNIIRLQIVMEDLVFPEYSSDLAEHVKLVNLLEMKIYKDFELMGEQFQTGNSQYASALSQFNEWKTIRDEIIKLTVGGPSPRAKKLVLRESASHAQNIRSALKELDAFSEKRVDDFDLDAFATSRENRDNK